MKIKQKGEAACGGLFKKGKGSNDMQAFEPQENLFHETSWNKPNKTQFRF
jgi:hypothetical protein